MQRIGQLGGFATVDLEGRDLLGRSNFHARISKLNHAKRGPQFAQSIGKMAAASEGFDDNGRSIFMDRIRAVAHNMEGRDPLGRFHLAIKRGRASAASPRSKLAKTRCGESSRLHDGCDISMSGLITIEGQNFPLDGAIFHLQRIPTRRNNFKIKVSTTSGTEHTRLIAQLAKSKGWFSPVRNSHTQFV
jgi:hypothetical protein